MQVTPLDSTKEQGCRCWLYITLFFIQVLLINRAGISKSDEV